MEEDHLIVPFNTDGLITEEKNRRPGTVLLGLYGPIVGVEFQVTLKTAQETTYERGKHLVLEFRCVGSQHPCPSCLRVSINDPCYHSS